MRQNQYRQTKGKTSFRQRSKRSSRWLKTQLFLSFLCFGLVAAWLYLPINSAQVERFYSQSIYPALSTVLVPLNSLLPFPLTLICLLIFVAAAIFNLARALRTATFWPWLVGMLFTMSLIAVWFFLAWGTNYQRLTVVEILDLDSSQLESSLGTASQEEDLVRLADYLLDVIERDVGEARSNTDAIPKSIEAISESLTTLLKQETNNAPELPKNVKYWPKGTLLRVFSASGVMLPWFIEPTVDAGLAESDRVAVAAHELAHAAGFATEGDADFIGTIAALSAENAFSRYSAALRSYRTISQELPKALKSELDLRLPPLAKSDWNDTFNAYAAYQAPTWLKHSNRTIYDSYLQSQGIEEGIKDYERSTQLLIVAQQNGLLP